MVLNLSELANGLPALSPACGGYFAEAGAVCFESQGHARGVALAVQGTYTQNFSVQWPEVTEQILNCLNDPEETTELGAVGVAILVVKKLEGYTVVQRARKKTGFDYWLGTESEVPFQNKARLEISGIRSGQPSQISRRVKEKLTQVSPSDDTRLPAYIVVVEFGLPVAEVRKK